MQNSTANSTSTDYPRIPDAILAISTDPAHRAALVTCRECSARVPASETNTDRPICHACYDIAGLENEHSDGYHAFSQNGPAAGCPGCADEAKARQEWEKKVAENPDGVPFTPEDEEAFLNSGGVATLEAPKTDADGYLLIDDDYNQDVPGDEGAGATPDTDPAEPTVITIIGDTTDGTQADTSTVKPRGKAGRPKGSKAKPPVLRAVRVVDGTGAPKATRKGRGKAPKATKQVPPLDVAKGTVIHPDGSVAWVWWDSPSMAAHYRCKVCGKGLRSHSVVPDVLPERPPFTPGATKAAREARRGNVPTPPVPTLEPEPVNEEEAPIEGVIVTG
jgi:hypothetical protein